MLLPSWKNPWNFVEYWVYADINGNKYGAKLYKQYKGRGWLLIATPTFKMSWKTFKFFEYEEVKDPETNEPLNKLKVSPTSSKLLINHRPPF